MQLCKYAKVTVFINKLFTDTLPCICPVQHNHSPWFLGVRIMQFIKNLITPKEADFSWMSCLSFNHGTELKAEDSIRILSVSLAPYTSQVAFHWRAGCSNDPAEVTTWQPTPAFTLCHIVGASPAPPQPPCNPKHAAESAESGSDIQPKWDSLAARDAKC